MLQPCRSCEGGFASHAMRIGSRLRVWARVRKRERGSVGLVWVCNLQAEQLVWEWQARETDKQTLSVTALVQSFLCAETWAGTQLQSTLGPLLGSCVTRWGLL